MNEQRPSFAWGNLFITFFASTLLHTSAYCLLITLAFYVNVTSNTGWWLYLLMPIAALVHTIAGVFFIKTKKRTRGIGYVTSGIFLFVLALNIGVLYYAFLNYVAQLS